jgi:hypothetical protein
MMLGEAPKYWKALQYAKPKVGRPCSEPIALVFAYLHSLSRIYLANQNPSTTVFLNRPAGWGWATLG